MGVISERWRPFCVKGRYMFPATNIQHQVASGYRPLFIGDALPVPPPRLVRRLQREVAPAVGSADGSLEYQNYSVLQHGGRGFPLWSCANLDGGQWQQINRNEIFPGGSDRWRKDSRLDPGQQWGSDLYLAEGSLFDKGHLTKREDVQWGLTPEEAKAGAASTFYYPNSVPQHKDLNRRIWARLEDYVLQGETNPNKLRVCVFSGPALRDDDPEFVHPIHQRQVRLPVWFWKVVYFPKSDGKLYRVGFLMNQSKLLERDEIIRPARARGARAPVTESRLFSNFKEAGTFQVNIPLIERLSGLRFPPAIDSYTDARPNELVLDETVVQPRQPGLPDELLGRSLPAIKGLKL
jgi:endonuclease G